jgi:hypothetical protein
MFCTWTLPQLQQITAELGSGPNGSSNGSSNGHHNGNSSSSGGGICCCPSSVDSRVRSDTEAAVTLPTTAVAGHRSSNGALELSQQRSSGVML